jgi:hypothetical protein
MTETSPHKAAVAPPRGPLGWLLTAVVSLGMLGLALESLLGVGPWLDLFWREAWMSPIVHALTGMSWQEFATDPAITRGLTGLGRGLGLLYLFPAVTCWLTRPRWLVTLGLGLATVLVAIDAFLSFLDAGGRIFQLIEHALQVLTPLIFLAWACYALRDRLAGWAMRLAIAGTFAGHGMWALGASFELGPLAVHYPTPGGWIDMVLSVLPASADEQTARYLLQAVGVLDWLAAIGVLLPGRAARIALLWAIAWGGATTAARIVTHLDTLNTPATFAYWTAEALRRTPHVGVPLTLWFLLQTTPEPPVPVASETRKSAGRSQSQSPAPA